MTNAINEAPRVPRPTLKRVLTNICFCCVLISGKTVLNQKSELQLALQKHKETQLRKEAEQERMAARTPLEITLEQRARRLEEVPTFLTIHRHTAT